MFMRTPTLSSKSAAIRPLRLEALEDRTLLSVTPECLEARTLLSATSGSLEEPNETEYATGLLVDTEAEATWKEENLVETTDVELNELGLERLAEEPSSASSLLLAASSEGDLATEALLGSSDLPAAVDNSELQYFPGIRSQGSLGSCTSFAVTYYTMTYMTAMARGWDASDPTDNTTKFSPKWTYNMVNGGMDGGSYLSSTVNVLMDHGAATWADVPYNSNYREWVYDDSDVWVDALNYRIGETGYVSDVDGAGQETAKTLLANGYVLNFATYIYCWQYGTISDDPSTTADDSEVGKQAAYWVNGDTGGHMMTIVGYNDDIWVDINGNGEVEEAEKGAFRIANSWGTGWKDGGFTWLSYDALNAVSEAGGPSTNREEAIDLCEVYWLTAEESYTPTLVAVFTVEHSERSQMQLSVGKAESGATPEMTWTPTGLTGDGGNLGFDGVAYSDSSLAPAGTFALDLTDLSPDFGTASTYFLGLNDTTDATVEGTITSFTITDGLGNVIASASDVPQTDGDDSSTTVYASVTSELTDFVVDASWTSVEEGSTTSIQVKLAAEPVSDVTVTANWLSGDSDLAVSSGSTLVFTSSNWDTYQAIEVSAGQDADDLNGLATLQIAASGLLSMPVRVQEVDDELIYVALLNEEPGWTYEGDWAWGVPEGGGGSHGYPDPTSASTGLNVIGDNLAGDYAANTSTAWVTTSAIDCSGYGDVELRFERWLNIQRSAYDHAYLQASNDGVTWTEIWSNSSLLTDDFWTLVSYDISDVAYDEETVYIRWGLSSNSTWQYSGWNIDDVVLAGTALTGGSENQAPVADNAVFSVSESAANTTVVGTVTASDADTPAQTLTYAITAGNGDGVFAINSSTGQITVADNSSLDYETISQYSLTVQVTDDGSPNLSDTATVTINVTGTNEAPVLGNATFSLDEDAANGVNVGTVSGTDQDSPAQTLTYAITAGNGDGVFAINSSTGLITVADNSSLDYETTSQYSLTVQVTDDGSPNLSDTATVTINVTGTNEAPVLGNATFSLDEDAANGVNVGTVSGTDQDSPAQTLTYAITAGNGDGVFAINSSTGLITVADNSSLDYETTSQYSLTVQVTDDGSPNLSDTATVTVNVTGVNESPVLGNATFSLDEDAANSANVGTVSGTDQDTPAQTLTYAITAGNGDGVFAINSSTGLITVADNSSLDYETTSQYSLTVQVTDDGSPNLSDTATVTINVTDVNEAPVLGNVTFSLGEDAANGANVGTVSGTDQDSPAQTLTYAITAGNGDGVFAINTSTGLITVADNSSLDYETTSQYSLTVQVTDDGSPNLSDTATVTINVTDVNDPPVLGDYTFSVSEDAANDAVVGVVEGSDEDDPPATLVYTIIAGDDEGVFKINPFSGEITVDDNSTLDYETTNQYTLTVQAEDNGYPSQSTTATVTINVNDVNEAPVLGNATFSIGEDAANDSLMGTVSGTDEDSPAQTLTYAITAGNGDGVFAINSSTGQITVANNSSLDYETTSQYSLTVQVTDDGSPSLSDTATVTINVTGVNEAPVLGNATFSLDEDAANGVNVGTVSGTDGDSPAQTLTYAITAGNGDGVFAINSSTGLITVADNSSLDYETTSQYSLTVQVTDDGSPNLSDTATVTINVTDVNEAPVLGNVTFSLSEDAANDAKVGTASGTDEDSPAQTLTYAITAGNGDGVFAINSSTGLITVADNSSLDYETTSQYSLTVQVTDDGSPNLSDTATITINVTDVNENPGSGERHVSTERGCGQRCQRRNRVRHGPGFARPDADLRDHGWQRRWRVRHQQFHGPDHRGRQFLAGLRHDQPIQSDGPSDRQWRAYSHGPGNSYRRRDCRQSAARDCVCRRPTCHQGAVACIGHRHDRSRRTRAGINLLAGSRLATGCSDRSDLGRFDLDAWRRDRATNLRDHRRGLRQ